MNAETERDPGTWTDRDYARVLNDFTLEVIHSALALEEIAAFAVAARGPWEVVVSASSDIVVGDRDGHWAGIRMSGIKPRNRRWIVWRGSLAYPNDPAVPNQEWEFDQLWDAFMWCVRRPRPALRSAPELMAKPPPVNRLERVSWIPFCPECGLRVSEFASTEEANADLDAHIESKHGDGRFGLGMKLAPLPAESARDRATKAITELRAALAEMTLNTASYGHDRTAEDALRQVLQVVDYGIKQIEVFIGRPEFWSTRTDEP